MTIQLDPTTAYISSLERRISELERERNQSFFMKSFSIWLHWLFANLVIATIGTAFYILIVVLFLGAVLHK